MLLMDQSWAMLRNCVLQGMVPFISVLKLCLVDSLAMQSGVCVACVRASHAKARCQFAFIIPHVQGTTGLVFILFGHTFGTARLCFWLADDLWL
jgi:hypothetical protein